MANDDGDDKEADEDEDAVFSSSSSAVSSESRAANGDAAHPISESTAALPVRLSPLPPPLLPLDEGSDSTAAARVSAKVASCGAEDDDEANGVDWAEDDGETGSARGLCTAAAMDASSTTSEGAPNRARNGATTDCSRAFSTWSTHAARTRCAWCGGRGGGGGGGGRGDDGDDVDGNDDVTVEENDADAFDDSEES